MIPNGGVKSGLLLTGIVCNLEFSEERGKVFINDLGYAAFIIAVVRTLSDEVSRQFVFAALKIALI